MSELRTKIARLIDPDAFKTKAEWYAELGPKMADQVFAKLQSDTTVERLSPRRREALAEADEILALPELASVGRDRSSQSQPGADAGPEARARTEAEPAAAWRSIESAPRDGTPVLLNSDRGEVFVGWWVGDGDHSYYDWAFLDELGGRHKVAIEPNAAPRGYFTNWAPILAPPAKNGADDETGHGAVSHPEAPDEPLPNTPLSAGKEG